MSQIAQLGLPQPQLFEPPNPPPLLLGFGEWLPDRPEFNNPGSPDIQNVLVASDSSYAPMPSFVDVGTIGLRHRCQGGRGFVDQGGSVNLFAGDDNDLYQLLVSSSTFAQVSKTAHAYSVPSTDQWKFAYFNGQILATQIGNPIQTFTLNSSSVFADLAAAAPKAKYIANWKDAFIAVAYTNDGSVEPQRVWWSKAGDCNTWPTPGSTTAAAAQSGYVDLLNDLGVIQGLVGGLVNADGAVIQEHGVKKVIYQGVPNVFDFLPCEGVRGTAAPGSICSLPGGLCFYYGEEGFVQFDGATAKNIGFGKVDNWFSKNSQAQYFYRMSGAVDPLSRNVFFGFAGLDSADGTCTKTLVYNYMWERWTLLNVSLEVVVQFVAMGYTLDQLYTLFGYTVDTVPAPFDSNVWIGGRYLLGAFDTSHKLAYATGPNLAARLMTKVVQPVPGKRTLCQCGRILVEGGATPYLAVGRQERLTDSPTYTDAFQMNSLGTSNARISGRYLRALVTTVSGDSWTHLMGAELNILELKGKR